MFWYKQLFKKPVAYFQEYFHLVTNATKHPHDISQCSDSGFECVGAGLVTFILYARTLIHSCFLSFSLFEPGNLCNLKGVRLGH